MGWEGARTRTLVYPMREHDSDKDRETRRHRPNDIQPEGQGAVVELPVAGQAGGEGHGFGLDGGRHGAPTVADHLCPQRCRGPQRRPTCSTKREGGAWPKDVLLRASVW